jgi:hypothetical protein
MNILDHISESLETIFWVKILKFCDADADPGSGNLYYPGSGMEKNLDSGSVINIPNQQHCWIRTLILNIYPDPANTMNTA